jgi:hypothetical protein
MLDLSLCVAQSALTKWNELNLRHIKAFVFSGGNQGHHLLSLVQKRSTDHAAILSWSGMHGLRR